MPRPLNEIIAHIRAVAANPAINTTLIQTEDLEALCEAALLRSEGGWRPDLEAITDAAVTAVEETLEAPLSPGHHEELSETIAAAIEPLLAQPLPSPPREAEP